MTMKVGLVACCLNTDHIRGMGHYVYEVMRQGAADPDFAWTVFGNDPSRSLKVPPGHAAAVDVFEFRGDRFSLWEQVGLPRRARARQLDVLHCTEGVLPWWQPLPTVVTLHDTMAFEGREDRFGARLYWDRLQVAALRRCAAIITGSQSARRDIVARWPDLAAKISVIPHGIAQEYLDPEDKPAPSQLQLDLGETAYILYVGGPIARKRLDWAVEVMLALGDPSLRLVACGYGAAAAEAARAKLPREAAERVVFAPFLSDEQLRALYRGARAALYPTLYEGFGFPAIEAQAAGTPVLFSPVSSLAELVGPLTWGVEPHDLQAWVAALRDVLSLPPATRTERAAEALKWARTFSWRASAEKHLSIYRDVHERVPTR